MSITISFENEVQPETNTKLELEYKNIDDLPRALQQSEEHINTYLTQILHKK